MILSVLPWALFLLVIAAWLPGLIYDPASLEVTSTFDKVWAVSFLAFPVVGVFLTRRLPGNPVGWLFLIGPALVGVGVSLGEYAESTGRQLGRLPDLALEIGLPAGGGGIHPGRGGALQSSAEAGAERGRSSVQTGPAMTRST
jgi:hypothetical protein